MSVNEFLEDTNHREKLEISLTRNEFYITYMWESEHFKL